MIDSMTRQYVVGPFSLAKRLWHLVLVSPQFHSNTVKWAFISLLHLFLSSCVSLQNRQFSYTSRQSLLSASRGDFMAPPARMAISIGLSRLWVPLSGTIFHLYCAPYHGICPLSNSFYRLLKTFPSPLPVLEAPLSSYLEGALHKFLR